MIQAQNKGVFYQCNWTAWLQRALLLKLSDLFIVPDTISLCPSLTFLFPSAFYSPCMLPFPFLPRSPPVSESPCGSSVIVLSPPLSPSFCLVFSWAVCRTCCWKELCTIGQEGMNKKKKKKIPRPQSSQGYNAQKTTCLQNCDAPRDQPAALAPSTDFPLKEEQVTG